MSESTVGQRDWSHQQNSLTRQNGKRASQPQALPEILKDKVGLFAARSMVAVLEYESCDSYYLYSLIMSMYMYVYVYI